MMIVRVRAETEKFPDAEMNQLQFRSPGKIPGEKGQDGVVLPVKPLQE